MNIKAIEVFEENDYVMDNQCPRDIVPGAECLCIFKGRVNFASINSNSGFVVKLKSNIGYKLKKIRPWDALVADSYGFDFVNKQSISLKNVFTDDVILSQILLMDTCLLEEFYNNDIQPFDLDFSACKTIKSDGSCSISLPLQETPTECRILGIKYIINKEMKMMPLLLQNTGYSKESSEQNLYITVTEVNANLDVEAANNDGNSEEGVEYSDSAKEGDDDPVKYSDYSKEGDKGYSIINKYSVSGVCVFCAGAAIRYLFSKHAPPQGNDRVKGKGSRELSALLNTHKFNRNDAF